MTVTISTPGDNAQLTFSGNAGQRVSVRATNVSMSQSGCCVAQLKVLKPDGTALSGLGGSYAWVDATSGGFLDAVTLPTSDTYTLLFQPQNNATGSVTLTLYSLPADPAPSITPTSGAGTTVTLSTTAPGQNIGPTFVGSAGQRVSVKVTNPTISGAPFSCCVAQIKVLKPDGTALSGLGGSYAWVDATSGGFLDTVTLSTNDTYTVFLDPNGIAMGSATLTVFAVPADSSGTITLAGPSEAMSTSTSGQNGGLTFSGEGGQNLNLALSSVTIGSSTCCSTMVKVLNPDGTTFLSQYFGTSGGNVNLVDLPTTGTYTISVDPQSDGTGSATFALADNEAACPEEGVFWKMLSGYYQFPYGAQDVISMKTHSLSSCVTPGNRLAGSGQTVRLLLNGMTGNYSEVGWRQYKCSNGSNCFESFMSTKINRMSTGFKHGVTFPAAPNCFVPGPDKTLRWRVLNVVGTTDFQGQVDCGDGQFRTIDVEHGAPWQWGIGEGEAFRRGNSDMAEIHRNLKWQDATNAWFDATGVDCRLDHDDVWIGQAVGNTGFDFVQGSMNCG